MKTYEVEYKNHEADQVNRVHVYAKNKREAYDKVVYGVFKGFVYSAWVSSVEYSNGRVQTFNNFEGNPY